MSLNIRSVHHTDVEHIDPKDHSRILKCVRENERTARYQGFLEAANYWNDIGNQIESNHAVFTNQLRMMINDWE